MASGGGIVRISRDPAEWGWGALLYLSLVLLFAFGCALLAKIWNLRLRPVEKAREIFASIKPPFDDLQVGRLQ